MNYTAFLEKPWKVLIIGDAMIDSYCWGSIDRMSPEAPVPVVSVHKREDRLGGAANVALNIKSLGGEAVLFSCTGEDADADLFLQLMEAEGLSTKGIVALSDRPTTKKTRIINTDKHVLRLDEESTAVVEFNSVLKMRLQQLIHEKPDVIVFEDYNKGLLQKELIAFAIEEAKNIGIPTLVDPKLNNFLAYEGVNLFKPNLKEIREGLDIEIDPSNRQQVEDAVRLLRKKLNCESVLLTLSEHGVFIQNQEGSHWVPAFPRNIVDVSGAGDTVVSVAAFCLASGMPNPYLATIANLAGGLVCEKVGVVPIDKQQLASEIEAHLG